MNDDVDIDNYDVIVEYNVDVDNVDDDDDGDDDDDADDDGDNFFDSPLLQARLSSRSRCKPPQSQKVWAAIYNLIIWFKMGSSWKFWTRFHTILTETIAY